MCCLQHTVVPRDFLKRLVEYEQFKFKLVVNGAISQKKWHHTFKPAEYFSLLKTRFTDLVDLCFAKEGIAASLPRHKMPHTGKLDCPDPVFALEAQKSVFGFFDEIQMSYQKSFVRFDL